MSKVCILIGEGKTERYFLPSLLEHQFGFSPLSEKAPHLYQKGEGLFWFFPFPPLATNPEGGKSRLGRTDTYRLANIVIRNDTYIFGVGAETHYRIIVDHTHGDVDGQNVQKEHIGNAIKTSGIPFTGHRVNIVENEMESWYFAGLKDDCPFISNPSGYRSLVAKEPERISDPKTHIASLLSAEARGTIKMAEIMGRHFDVAHARERSASFNEFIAGLEEDGLI